ncbi:MAG: glycine cleavage system protein H, partial [Acidobacteria bacterium]|nr:glycine cleavage system protein H [Acidobacteriota bacterium]
CRYTASHCWLREEPEGVWSAGFTGFAAWLLGDPVEFDFTVSAGAVVAAGQEIGWVEGLKAVNAVFSEVEGEFLGAGDGIAADITLMERDPYGRGWLYRVRGQPAPDTLDVEGYIAVLNEAVDAVIRNRQAECGGECEG